MDNRILHNQTFTSHYFDPTKRIRKNKKNESHVDFYIFFANDEVSVNNICSFHVPFSYIYEYAHASFQSEEEAFIVEILLHQKVNYVLNAESKIEELYQSLLEYFCYGEDIFHTLNSYRHGFGIIALFDESFHKPTITSIVEPEVNRERFYYKELKHTK